MVYFRKLLPESIVNDCNERIVRHGLSVIRSSVADEHDNHDSSDGSGTNGAADQKKRSKTIQPNQGTLLIEAIRVPADIRHPTDLSLLIKSRELDWIT